MRDLKIFLWRIEMDVLSSNPHEVVSSQVWVWGSMLDVIWIRGGNRSSCFLMMPKSSPVRCTIPALVAVAYKREQHKNTLPKAPVWSRPNTLRRLSQKSFYNSRVLERSQSRVPFYEEDVGAFSCGATKTCRESIRQW